MIWLLVCIWNKKKRFQIYFLFCNRNDMVCPKKLPIIILVCISLWYVLEISLVYYWSKYTYGSPGGTLFVIALIIHVFEMTVMSQLMRWYLSHRWPMKPVAGLRSLARPSLFAHMKYGSRRRVRPNIRHLAPLDGCTWAFEEWVYGGHNVP